MREQVKGEWIVEFYADGVIEPVETVRHSAIYAAIEGLAIEAVNEEITAADWWALTARVPGRFYVTAKHSQAPESSRAWAKVDVVSGRPQWVDCKAPAFWSRRQGPGVAMPGEAEGWKAGDRALVAFAVGDRVEVTPATFKGKCWHGTRYGGKYLFWADVGTRVVALRGVDMPDSAVDVTYTYATAIIRQREGGTPDIAPRHPLADGEVFDPWQAAAEAFGVDVDAVKAAAGCPDRWWFVYDYPDEGSDLVKAPTRRMAGELSVFMRGSDPPHDFDELTIEPATMDALAERCLAHEMADPRPPILVVNGAVSQETINAIREQFGPDMEAPTMITIDTTHAETRARNAAESECAREIMVALGLTVADAEGADLLDALDRVRELRLTGKRIGMTLASMPEAMREWLGATPGSRLPEPGDKPTAVHSPLGRGTEGELRIIMTDETPRAMGVYTWTDGHDDGDGYMATPGWWGDGEPGDVYGPVDVAIWARLPEGMVP
jgi:hypothetical protein